MYGGEGERGGGGKTRGKEVYGGREREGEGGGGLPVLLWFL